MHINPLADLLHLPPPQFYSKVLTNPYKVEMHTYLRFGASYCNCPILKDDGEFLTQK